MNQINHVVLFLVLLTSPAIVGGQVVLKNPSFEGTPKGSTMPDGWLPCSPGTTPDLLPTVWGVYQEADDGDTYVGLIVRGDGSSESIGQRLPNTLKPGQCYAFTLSLAHARTYAGYNKPVQLRIWGSEELCGTDQILLHTSEIRKTTWGLNQAVFFPKKPIRYLMLEAYYPNGGQGYQGNVLIDKISAIEICKRA